VAGRGKDGLTLFWSTDSWQLLARYQGAESQVGWANNLGFSLQRSAIASVEEDGRICVWDVSFPADGTSLQSVAYTSAKIVLVGESNVGKSCLAMRLAEDRYPEDHEHGTTHGMRFWPMEAEELHPSAKPPEGQRRDVVLWDFGGQDEYQLVHQIFLHDTTLALVLIDPTRGDVEFNRAREWNKRLEKQLGQRRAVKLLVGAQVDDDKKSGLIHRGAIRALCEECGFAGFYETSALTGREIQGFRDALAGAVD